MRVVSRWAGVAAPAVALGSIGALAQDGETLYNTETGMVCHGAAPIAPTYPKLAAQNKA